MRMQVVPNLRLLGSVCVVAATAAKTSFGSGPEHDSLCRRQRLAVTSVHHGLRQADVQGSPRSAQHRLGFCLRRAREKNRYAQRRYRERQRTKLQESEDKVAELTDQLTKLATEKVNCSAAIKQVLTDAVSNSEVQHCRVVGSNALMHRHSLCSLACVQATLASQNELLKNFVNSQQVRISELHPCTRHQHNQEPVFAFMNQPVVPCLEPGS